MKRKSSEELFDPVPFRPCSEEVCQGLFFFLVVHIYGNNEVGVGCHGEEGHAGEMVCFEIRSLRKKKIPEM